jgi:formamidopyrimidine-DNA glycosylase
MPELPEVEVLVRHLAPLICGRTIRRVRINRARVLASTAPDRFRRTLRGATFSALSRRGKYLLFTVRLARSREKAILVGHLGMTGRMYLLPARARLPKHAAVVLNLGRDDFVFEDTRYFGRLTLDGRPVARLGPEPLGGAFTPGWLAATLRRSV